MTEEVKDALANHQRKFTLKDAQGKEHSYLVHQMTPLKLLALVPDFCTFFKYGAGDLAKALLSNAQFEFLSSGDPVDLDVDLSKLADAVGGFGDAIVEIQDRRERKGNKKSIIEDLLFQVFRDGEQVLAGNNFNQNYKGNYSELFTLLLKILEANFKDSVLAVADEVTIPIGEVMDSAIKSVMEKAMDLVTGS